MMSDQNGIYITKKEASVCAAIVVVLGLLIFIAGYFYGKQSVIDGFTQKATQESFNDKVDYLLTMQSFAEKNGGVDVVDGQANSVDVAPSVPADIASLDSDVPALLRGFGDAIETECDAPAKAGKSSKKNKQELKSQASQASLEKRHGHYAVLAGFGKRASAATLVGRLKKQNIDVEIRQKTSKSASGKATRNWFQIITKSYDSKQDVQNLVDKILSLEKIKRSEVKIV